MIAPSGSSKFQRLALTHAAMMGGEAAMVVALADSFFFDVDPTGARGKVLGFLVISFAPFLVIAPMIGPLIDRVHGGRRLIIQVVAAARIGVQLAMIPVADSIGLFPLVFIALVLQKTYGVSKSALVPAVVSTERELVEANSKLGLIAGIAGAVAVVPAGVLQLAIGTAATMTYSVLIFAFALFSALRLPPELATRRDRPSAASPDATTTSLQLAWVAMLILRAAVGFTLFHVAFWLREADGGKLWIGAAVAMSSGGTMLGNAIAPRLRRVLHEEWMITLALALGAGAGLVAAAWDRPPAAVLVGMAVNFAAALGRLSFESIVQRDGPATNRGQAFARFETRFQLGWVVAAVLPVLLDIPGAVGFLLIGVVCGAAVLNYRSGIRGEAADQRRRARTR